MKIAIQGHPTRGKEVIQILESLGGVNDCPLTGKDYHFFYYIYNDSRRGIRCHYDSCVDECEKYTLEEFEKEFPFKVGDTVITTYGRVGIISSFTSDNDKFPYCIVTKRGISFHNSSELKPYEEMDTRNVTLTLEKAKEWYNKGGELKEVALQAFTKEELNPLPRSWEDFYKQYGFKNSLDNCLDAININFAIKYTNKFKAFVKLQYLRDCWWNGWEPEWKSYAKYSIKNSGDGLSVITSYNVAAFLTFPTREKAEDFLACFRDLIEKAGDLI